MLIEQDIYFKIREMEFNEEVIDIILATLRVYARKYHFNEYIIRTAMTDVEDFYIARMAKESQRVEQNEKMMNEISKDKEAFKDALVEKALQSLKNI